MKYWFEPEKVTLPSGLTVMVCRPTHLYFDVLRSQWPESLVEKIDFAALSGACAEWTQAETTFLGEELRHLTMRSIIEGTLSARPSTDISLNLALDDTDAEFLRDYLLAPTLEAALRDPFEAVLAGSANSGSARVN